VTAFAFNQIKKTLRRRLELTANGAMPIDDKELIDLADKYHCEAGEVRALWREMNVQADTNKPRLEGKQS
jgi:hypothetical protein